MSKLLERAKTLAKRDREIIRISKRDPAPTMAAIGRKFGISRARVSQIVNGARTGS
jgi:DNA-directed RNA polymerase specialized sigma subunit